MWYVTDKYTSWVYGVPKPLPIHAHKCTSQSWYEQRIYGELQMLMVQLYSHNASKANLYRKQESSNIATRHSANLKSPTYYRVAVEIQQFGDQCSSNNVLQIVSIQTLTYNIASYCCFQNESTASMHRWHAIMVCISRGTTSLLIRSSVVYQAIPETGLAR